MQLSPENVAFINYKFIIFELIFDVIKSIDQYERTYKQNSYMNGS